MRCRKFRPSLQVETLESRTVLSAAVGLTTGNQLLFFDTDTPGSVSAPLAITGLAGGERVLSIDYRPADSQLYAISSANRVLRINDSTGAATQMGTSFTTALVGSKFGIDFNPTVDRIRLVSDAGQNLRFHPDLGTVVGLDGDLAYSNGDINTGAVPAAVAAAYIDNFPGTTTTLLFVIDANLSTLTLQAPPNDGILNTVTFLGISTTNMVGFDIQTTPDENVGFATFSTDGGTQLYRLHLYGDPAAFVGTLGTNQSILDISLRLGGGAGPAGSDTGLPSDVIVGLTLTDEATPVQNQGPVGTLDASLRSNSVQDLILTPSAVQEATSVLPTAAARTEVDSLFATGFTLADGFQA